MPGQKCYPCPGLHRGKVPPCPELISINAIDRVTPGWCLDPGNVHPGATTCWRSHGTGTVAGQQCCYGEFGGLLTEGAAAGTIDKVGTATGIKPNGSCKFNLGLAAGHFVEDVERFLDDPESYNEIQECIRAAGAPSGSGSSHPYEGGITDAQLDSLYDQCEQQVTGGN